MVVRAFLWAFVGASCKPIGFVTTQLPGFSPGEQPSWNAQLGHGPPVPRGERQPLVQRAALVGLQDLVARWTEARNLVMGAWLIAVVLAFAHGLAGAAAAVVEKSQRVAAL